MKKTLLALAAVFACGCWAPAAAQTAADPAKVADIKRLLELTGAAAVATNVAEQQLQQLRPLFDTLPAESRDRVVKEFEEMIRRELSSERLLELSVPIYDKYLTAEDLRGMIAFYESPLGQKVVSVFPKITQEAFEAGAARGREAGRHIYEKLLKEGLLNPQKEEIIATPPAKQDPPPPRRPGARRRRG